MSDLNLLCFGCERPFRECACGDGPTGYTARCESCDHVWDVSAAEADREADWPEYNWQKCPKCGSSDTYAVTEDTE